MFIFKDNWRHGLRPNQSVTTIILKNGYRQIVVFLLNTIIRPARSLPAGPPAQKCPQPTAAGRARPQKCPRPTAAGRRAQWEGLPRPTFDIVVQ